LHINCSQVKSKSALVKDYKLNQSDAV